MTQNFQYQKMWHLILIGTHFLLWIVRIGSCDVVLVSEGVPKLHHPVLRPQLVHRAGKELWGRDHTVGLKLLVSLIQQSTFLQYLENTILPLLLVPVFRSGMLYKQRNSNKKAKMDGQWREGE